MTQNIKEKVVLAKLLPLDTAIVDSNYQETTIGDLMETIDRPHDIGVYYLANVIEMKKPDTSFFSENIGENMDENHEYRLEKYEDHIDSLQSAIQEAFDKWRENLGSAKEIYALDTEIDFTGFEGYIQ